jgi:Protein of unknown function (DUF3302)
VGFKVDAWDLFTFAVILLLIIAFLIVVVLILGLPGRIAIARKHPDADAVKLMGWLGFMAIIPWFQALLWAFKPTDVIDIRRYPEQEQRRIREMIDKLKGVPASPSDVTKPSDSAEGLKD